MLALSAVTQSPTNGFSDCPDVVSVQESSSAENVPAAQARKIQNPLPKVVGFTRIFLARGGLHKLLGPHVAAAPQSADLGPRSELYSLSHDRQIRLHRARFRRAGWLLW